MIIRKIILPVLVLFVWNCFGQSANELDANQQQQSLFQQQEPRAYVPDAQYLDFVYHDHDELTRFLRTTSARYPNLTALYSIGKSVQGRDLWVMVVSASPYEHMIGKPDVKYVGNIHGNEPVGRELLLHLIQYFVTSYYTDPYIKWLLDNTRIHILPAMNPDGYAVSKEGSCDGGQGRYNARGFDLNRNFPDYFKQNNKRGQPETDAVKEWISKIQFVLSGSLHGGALVASYPYDNTPNSRICRSSALCASEYSPKRYIFHRFFNEILFQLLCDSIITQFILPIFLPIFSTCPLGAVFQSYASAPSLTPDDDVFKHLSLTYANNHAKMSRGVACKSATPAFEQGITNGAAWYPLTGGMQDYNYVWYGCMEVTLEISCCKFPPAHELRKYWEDNQLSLIKFLAEVHRGVQGFVMDPNGAPIERASLKVKGRDVGFQTTKFGEFWRILLPGVYKLEVYADGYLPKEVEFMVVEQHPTLLNVTLQPGKRSDGGAFLYRPIASPPHFRPQSQPQIGSETGIFTSISNSLNSLYSNIFG
ncbi:carboxypeptidase D isoform X2 [Condylostylus longicornis]|uniref:carboxypeptidase D isoform X2 n=1 Tax=Condylostylus longicornis TaxID=2530218 RepID=UPI00244DCFE3|nr:carboxypeptidase D isoform X2 [Condylostylus longicornis]